MEIAIVKDLLRGTPHVVVARSGNSLLAKSVTQFGESMAKTIQASGKLDHKVLPDGFSATEFKSVTDNVAAMVMDTYINPEIDRIKVLEKTTSPQLAKSHNERNVLLRTGISKAPSSLPLRSVSNINAKLNLIDYKASKFKTTSRLGSVISTIRNTDIGFDSQRNVLVSRKNDPASRIVIDRIVRAVGHGPLRRFMQEKTSDPTFNASTRRAARRAKILDTTSNRGLAKNNMNLKMAESIKARFK